MQVQAGSRLEPQLKLESSLLPVEPFHLALKFLNIGTCAQTYAWTKLPSNGCTFIAMDADTKLVFSWLTGKRSTANTYTFMRDVYARTAWGSCPQITTDGWGPYVPAMNATFRDSVDYAQLVKIYGSLPAMREGYAPSRYVESISKVVTGNPDPQFVSTSYIERQNLTIRMMSRRFTRLTNAFSKKLSHLKAAIALHFAYYNLCRVHSSLRVTPAMQAGLAEHIWTLQELLSPSQK